METESPQDAVWLSIKDIYGRDMGEIVGVIFNLNGGIESVGVRESGGRFVTYPRKLLTKSKSEFKVVPEWKQEALTLDREKESIVKRERAIEEMSRVHDANPKVFDEAMKQIEVLRANHEKLKEKVEARLKELEARYQSVSDFIGMVKLQHATSETDDGSYLVTQEFGRVELEADGRELGELRHAVGILEDIEEKVEAPLPSTDTLPPVEPMLPILSAT